jgi:hypothetical protein
MWALLRLPRFRGATHASGHDIAKSVFQVHGVDAAGQVLIRRQLKRRADLAFFQKLVSELDLSRTASTPSCTTTGTPPPEKNIGRIS